MAKKKECIKTFISYNEFTHMVYLFIFIFLKSSSTLKTVFKLHPCLYGKRQNSIHVADYRAIHTRSTLGSKTDRAGC